jgi:hypothetical protein
MTLFPTQGEEYSDELTGYGDEGLLSLEGVRLSSLEVLIKRLELGVS